MSAMNELAALTIDDLGLPPVSDVRRDEELAAAEERVAAAETAVAEARWDDAIAALAGAAIAPAHLPDLALRALLAESWARMHRGELDAALELLKTAKRVAHRPGFNDVDRAEVLYRIGCVRVKRSATSRAVTDFTLALELCERSGRRCDRLRAEIREWRSRCYQRQRDDDAARADVEHALELAESIDDRHTAAHVNFRASVIAERHGQWLLARFYAEKAKDLYAECGDETSVARLLIREVASLAQVHLRAGNAELAEPQARHALELLAGRTDATEELGNVQLVLGRSLLEQGRLDEAAAAFGAAELAFTGVGSPALLAAAWLAQGDLARALGDADAAATLFRRAAEELQDGAFVALP
jgi:tetratricopeptide (TPR) repeat protein